MSGRVAAVVGDLTARKANVRCSEMREILEGLGFTIREGSNGNHRIFTHRGLEEFKSSSYDCGHGRDSLIKASYVVKVVRVLSENAIELNDFLEK